MSDEPEYSVDYDVETYLLSWDMHGLESCINVTEIEHQKMFDILKTGENNSSRNTNEILNMVLLRARFNSQRHYEVYALDVKPHISKQDIETAFEDDPQGMADLVRKRGRCLHSDRVDSNKIKIT